MEPDVTNTIPEETPPAEPAVPAPPVDPFEETIETIRGKKVRLSANRPFWATESGKIVLNAFTGKVSAEVPYDLGNYDRLNVIAGLRSGAIVLTDRIEDATPGVQDPNTIGRHEDNVQARRLLDEPKADMFADMIRTIKSLVLLERAVEIESADANRKEYVKILKARIREITEG